MVQELLNRSDQYLWAIVANGGTLRLLRDSSNLVGQAYVEFDLEAMFDGEVFSDFVVLFLLAHQSRFEVARRRGTGGLLAGTLAHRRRRDRHPRARPAPRRRQEGHRGARHRLPPHPANADLRDRLADGGLDLADYHRALLRLVYRLLFLLRRRGPWPAARPRCASGHACPLQRLVLHRPASPLATRRRGTRHADLWQALSLVLDGLGHDG